MPRDAQRRAGLRSFRHFQNVFAFESGNADFRAQGSLGKRNRNHAVQVVPLTLEEGMLFHVQNYVQVARRAAVQAAFSVSGEANAGAVFHAGGNFCVHRPLPQHPAFAFALGTGIGDHAARALAGGTGARNAEEALLVADLAAAIAGTAGDRELCPGPHLNLGIPRRSRGAAP